jgi:hypothetical protein
MIAQKVAVGRFWTSGAPLAFALDNRPTGECPSKAGGAIGRSSHGRGVWLLSQGQLNAFPAQKHRSEPLMIIEPEISLCRRDAAGADLCGAVISSADTERACAHDCHCDRNRDSNPLLDGWHDDLRPAADRHTTSYY